MKVLIISHAYVVAENQKKIKALSKKGVSITLFVPKIWKDTLRTIKAEEPFSPSFDIVKADVVFSGKISAYFYINRLWSVLRKFKPDIVHIEEEPWSFAVFQILTMVKLTGVKSKVVFFSWENILRKYKWINNIIEKYFLRRADWAIVGSEDAKDVLVEKGFYENRISVIPQMGVDTNTFKKQDSTQLRNKLGLKTFTIGFLGRFVYEKGIGVLLNAYLKMSSKAQLFLVGNGPYINEIDAFIKKHSLNNSIIIVKSVNHSDVGKYINCMDVLVLPSLSVSNWREQFGHVIIEAFACEVPVIGSSSGAIPEVVGEGGIIFKEGDANDLYAKLVFLMDNEEGRRKLGKLGGQRVREFYTNEKIAMKIYDIYKSLWYSG